MELMSWAAFFNLTFTGTCQWVFGWFLKNRRSREHIHGKLIYGNIFTIFALWATY